MGSLQGYLRPAWRVVLLLIAGAWLCPAQAQGQGQRFFYSGDGRIHLVSAKTGRTFAGFYRRADGTYDPAALHAIQAAFDAPADQPMAQISLRLIEFIDFLQDHFRRDARVEIASGWSSPEYNTHLREQGRLAATASLHQYGMAADLKIGGIHSRRVWEFVRRMGFGGAGYYQGDLVHVDVGPARSWDEKSSGVGTDLSAENKLICLVADYDIYRAGDPVQMRFTRMTAFPVGVNPEFALIRRNAAGDGEQALFRPQFSAPVDGSCAQWEDFGQLMNIRWRLPGDLAAGKYVIRASFCQKPWEAMPAQIATAEFEVR